jgi:hypothetical protein
MPAPIRSVPFKRSARTNIWNTVLQALRKPGSDLARAVKTFRALEGTAEDLAEGPIGAPANLTESLMPWMRVSLAGGSAEWLSERQHKASMTLVVELAVAGTNVPDVLDFWSAVEAQLFPGNNELLNALNPFGVFSKTIKDPAVTPRLIGGNAHALYAIGVIAFNHTITS